MGAVAPISSYVGDINFEKNIFEEAMDHPSAKFNKPLNAFIIGSKSYRLRNLMKLRPYKLEIHAVVTEIHVTEPQSSRHTDA